MTNNSPIRIALIGNPNTGKSTLFNRLTGLRQHITNYPGTTVLAHTGFSHIEDKQVQFIDLPGIYSLSASSPDEKVVFDLLLCDNKIDLILFILDSTNLRRSFFLIYQLAEFEIPCLLVLNQWDQAIRNCIKINLQLLKSRLPVPIVTTIARNGIGLEELRSAIATSLKSPSRFPLPQWPTIIEECRQTLLNAGANLSLNLKPPEATRIIFDSDSIYLKNFSPSLHSQLSQLQSQIQNRLRQNGFNLSIAEATIHYRKIDKLLENVIQSDGTIARSDSPLDSILLHKFWGPVIFFAIMFLVFQSLYAWSAPFTDAIESLIALAKDNVFLWLEKFPILQSLTTDGILTGVGSVLVFLPQILLLFLFISLLEESGYLARAAFIMDKALAWCGLNGKCFVPLLSGYACSIPAILSTRTLDSPSARLTTTLLIPFMSCSARLPVYTLFISAFIEPKYGPNIAALSLFFMHFVGPLVAFPFAWFLNRKLLRTPHQTFVLEFPHYQLPSLRNVTTRLWESARDFLQRAGSIILAISIILWALLYFPRPPELASKIRSEFLKTHANSYPSEQIHAQLSDPNSPLSEKLQHTITSAYLEQSYLGRLGKFLQPIFSYAGFDWKITIAILGSFPAREVLISTLGIIYNLGGDISEESADLHSALSSATWPSGPKAGYPIFSLPTVWAIMVFFALCLQCGATIAVVAQEINWRWAIGLFLFMSFLAWLGATLTYQILSKIPHFL